MVRPDERRVLEDWRQGLLTIRLCVIVAVLLALLILKVAWHYI